MTRQKWWKPQQDEPPKTQRQETIEDRLGLAEARRLGGIAVVKSGIETLEQAAQEHSGVAEEAREQIERLGRVQAQASQQAALAQDAAMRARGAVE